MSNRKEKHFMLSQKNIEYIEEVKEKNNLKYNSEALDLIIREHRTNSDVTTEAMIKLIAKEVSENIQSDIIGIKRSSKNSDRNTQVLIELFNGLCVINGYGRLATTDYELAPAVRLASDVIDKRIDKEIKKAVYKK
ncbi:MAG: hypothetical protein KH415_11235 [Clostridium sp.]|nr:hypothetical protein [Clostridium sp.]